MSDPTLPILITTRMTTQQLREVWKADPFRPFTIHLADGRSVTVNHRDFLMLSPSGRTIVVFDPQDRMNILDLLLVTNLQIEPANGSRPRKKK